MIRIRNLKKLFQTEEIETTASNSINIDIKKGEFVAVMGLLAVENLHFSFSLD